MEKSIFKLSPLALFTAFTVVNTLAVFVNHIDDTDETYGYWEPLHYLVYGRGMQTWEYSPDNALRSYSYISWLVPIAGFIKKYYSPVEVFYSIKALLGAVNALSQCYLVTSVGKLYGDFNALILFVLLIFAPGVFYLSTSLLPSASCSTLVILSIAFCMNDRLVLSILAGCLAVIVTGWPFIGAIFAPIGVYMIMHTSISNGLIGLFKLIFSGILILLTIFSISMVIEHHYYQKWY